MIDRELIDKMSWAFTQTLAEQISDYDAAEHAELLRLVDLTPVNFLNFAAAVAEAVYKIHVVNITDFDSKEVSDVARAVKKVVGTVKNGPVPFILFGAEDRLMLFFASVLRVADTLLQKKELCDISDEMAQGIKDRVSEIKISALAYKICSEAEVKEWFDGSGMPL